MSKWQKFHSAYSPVTINKPNTAGGNLALDWLREAGQDRMTINGKPLSHFKKDYNDFETTEDVKKFFDEVILQDVGNIDKVKRAEIINYLETAFHQGGFMYPVSGAFSISMKEYNEEYKQEDVYATVGNMDMMINVQTTPKGFKVQEITGVKNFRATPGTSAAAMANEEYSIEPDQGNKYVVELRGTIDIDFSKSSDSPSITVENNGISYGHAGMQSKIDSRNLGQKIVDFFRNILGLNQVEDISSKFKPEASMENNTDNDDVTSSPKL